MKKYLLLTAAMTCAMAFMTACGAKENASSNEEADATEQVAEEATEPQEEEAVVEETGLKAPFTITSEFYVMSDVRKINEYEVLANGMFKMKSTRENKKGDNWIADGDPHEQQGKWTTRHRTLGEGSQKVYVLSLPNYDIFIPEDGEYVYDATDWSDCDNFVTEGPGIEKVINVAK